MKKTFGFSIFFVTILGVIALTDCISIAYIKTGNYSDHSYPVTGNLAETGTITYIKKRFFLWEIWKKPEPSEGDGITIRGLAEWVIGFGQTSSVLPQSNEDKARLLIVNMRHDTYTWKGHITSSGIKVNADFSMDIYGYEEPEVFVLHKAYTQNPLLGIELTEAWAPHIAFEIPYEIGILRSGMNTYRLCFVLEDAYAVSSEETVSDEEKAYYLDRHRNRLKRNFYDFLLREDQKFQIINSENRAVAEMYGSTYVLYDTLPENERHDIKQGIGIFYAFLHKVKELYTKNYW
jgi:hypothetical protein